MTRHENARRLRTDDDGTRLSMTPMIDVTFLILIFFMCTLKFKTLEGKLGAELPKDVGVIEAPQELVEKLVVRIEVAQPGDKVRRTRDGTIVLYTAEDEAAGRRFEYDASRVLRYRVGAKRTGDFDDVRQALQRHFDAVPERRVTIDPREGTSNKDVVQVLDALLDAGFKDVSFMGSAER